MQRRSYHFTRMAARRPPGEIRIGVVGSDVALCERCSVADGSLSRLRGLLGRHRLARDEGLLLRPAAAIHTMFMRFAIDAVFLDRELRVVGIRAVMRPWRFAGRRRARSVLELAAGRAGEAGLRVGDRLETEALAGKETAE